MAEPKRPAWFIAKMDQRRAQLSELADTALLSGVTVTFAFLSEPDEDTDAAVARWEQTCDGCGAYCPGELHPGQHVETVKGVQLLIAFGVCSGCKEGFE